LGRSFHELHPLFKTMAGRLDKRSLEAIESRGSLRGVPGVPAGIRRLFVTAHEIDPVFHVKMQAAFQRYVDNAVSKTVNLPADSSPADVERVFRAAHELGCKGVTVYRYGSKVDEVLRFPEYAGSCRDMTCPN
ncbi:MAG: ribonucleotide reductase, partial [Methanothermobacter sp.]|nr:ribonucleotide reductase [Methanothermobacter sp.]